MNKKDLLAHIEYLEAKIEVYKSCHSDLVELLKEVAFDCDSLAGRNSESGYTIKKKL